jgi:hypothetical protein
MSKVNFQEYHAYHEATASKLFDLEQMTPAEMQATIKTLSRELNDVMRFLWLANITVDVDWDKTKI